MHTFFFLLFVPEEREDDCYGFNMLGCLQEKAGLFNCAVNSFIKALKLSPKQYMNLIRSNLGRVYIRMKNYKEALKILREVVDSDFQTQCNIGLAYFKGKIPIIIVVCLSFLLLMFNP